MNNDSAAGLEKKECIIVGGGLVGALLSIYLAKRGLRPSLYERREDLRKQGEGEGRSINLVATHRGIQALDRMGLKEEVLKISIPVFGRMIYQKNGGIDYHPYGKGNSECNYSVSRAHLNRLLLDAAEKAGVHIYFNHNLKSIDFEKNILSFAHKKLEEKKIIGGQIFGADGGGSVVRRELIKYWKKKGTKFSEGPRPLGVAYKELFMPKGHDGDYPIEKKALHIWPRGKHFLMALPNLDNSFTMTLYLPETGEYTFEKLNNTNAIREYFIKEYPSAYQLIPHVAQNFLENPYGQLATTNCNPWNEGEKCMLIGDAAHGIVPFFGQGMNAGFEDCEVLDDLMNKWKGDWKKIFKSFSDTQKPNGDAIAEMAIQNFIEMSEKVGDRHFLFEKEVEKYLGEKFPHLYKSRYRLVVYTSIPYHHCQKIGEIQTKILSALCRGKNSLTEIDDDKALSLIEKLLMPYLEKYKVTL